MTACSKQILKDVRVVTSFAGVLVDNALTFENNNLQFGGPLVKDTDVTDNYALNFGTTVSRLREFNVRTRNQINLEYINGINGVGLHFNASGVLVTNTLPFAKGLSGGSDFRANYDELTYIQKIYADTTIAGKPISPILATPGPGHNTFTIAWDDTAQRFTLAPSGAVTAGQDTQVIFNSNGVLVGNSNLTFTNNILSAPNINIGSTGSLPGANRTIQVISNTDDTGLIIKPKGTGNLYLSLLQGSIIIGDSTSANTNHIISAAGSNNNIDLTLETKGTDSKLYVGDVLAAGANRYIKSRGFNASVNLVLEGKGTTGTTGKVTLNPASDGDTSDGTVNIGLGNAATPGDAYRRFYAESNFTTTHLFLGGYGVNSNVYIGRDDENATNRYILPASSSPNANLVLTGKGTGSVIINNIGQSVIPIGDWNMLTTLNKSVTHNIPGGGSKIISVFVKIFTDGNTIVGRNFTSGGDGVGAGGIFWDASQIHLQRVPGGEFEHTNYDATGFNRGFIHIIYELI